MPLLGGLFNKRNPSQKHHVASSNTPSATTESVASCTTNRDSADGDLVPPDNHLPPPTPIYNLPASASSTRLKLPFRRKPIPIHSLPNEPSTSLSAISLHDLPSPYISSVTSDPGHGLSPPPRKSFIFGAYTDSLPSVHSLPNDSSSHVHSDTPPRLSLASIRTDSSPLQSSKKSPGLFAWARERTKSKPTQPISTPSTTLVAEDPPSFLLKSFRHVRADSSAISLDKSPQPLPDPLLVPPRPRPRGDSVASDSSQRISVAAFREAQARSRANSPVPSFRPPSTADTLRVDVTGRKRASTVSVVSPIDPSQSSENTAVPPLPSLRPGSSTVDTSSDSDSSEEEEDEDVDSDGEPIPKSAQDRTITRRVVGARARSDAGHGSVPASNSQISHSPDPPESSKPVLPLTSQSDQAPAPVTRPRASISTSSMTPSGAALRASNLAALNMPSGLYANSKPSPRKPNDDSDRSSTSSDSEDMPLRDLVAPRRPGSAASNYSNGRPRIPPKPLIDINSLAGGPPLLTPILRHENSIKNLNGKPMDQDGEKDQPFSIPAALAFSSSSSPISPPPSKQDPLPVNRPASTAFHRRSSSDAHSPLKPKGPDNDDDLINAIRLVGALDKESELPSGTLKPPAKAGPDRIVPTPIREREPPTSFTVLSRPPQRHSTADTSTSLSPGSQTRFNSAPPTTSPQPDTSVRQRVPAMLNPSAQNDRSDALSISSTAPSSTSRESSRVPLVPLIHSIPDSPSVKEEYKSSHLRRASHGSAPSPTAGRPKPTPTTLASALSSTPGNKPSQGARQQASSVPQRPFSSEISVRGESPAGSSTGDSSSGRSPFTPRDGSDIGARSKEDVNPDSTVKARGHAKKLSVTFEDAPLLRGRERGKTDPRNEQKTRERRRSEAKAAIELGKIVNGRGPLVHDGSDEDVTMRGRNPTINVTMDSGVHGIMQPSWGTWQQPMGTGMSSMVPPQFSNDPAFLAAHQRALLIAKQAYQMAVAQHAMQMAGEEWERSSNVGFSTAGSVYGGGGSVYGGGSGGSVYGGGNGGSVYGGIGAGTGMAPMAMMATPGMGMLMPPPTAWGRSSVAFPTSGASVYAGMGNPQSEYGGGAGWGTRSVYGEPPPLRPSSSHGHSMGSGAPSSATSAFGGNARPRASTGGARSSGQAAKTPGKNAARSRAAPPSSWKNSR